MNTTPTTDWKKERKLYQDQQMILITLLVALVLNPSEQLRTEILQYAEKMLEPQTSADRARMRLRQYDEKNPLLWFWLIRQVKENNYDFVNLLIQSNRGELQNSQNPRGDITRAILQSSPFPNARWQMHEWHKGKPSSIVIILEEKLNYTPRNIALPGARVYVIWGPNRQEQPLFQETIRL